MKEQKKTSEYRPHFRKEGVKLGGGQLHSYLLKEMGVNIRSSPRSVLQAGPGEHSTGSQNSLPTQTAQTTCDLRALLLPQALSVKWGADPLLEQVLRIAGRVS